MFQKILILTKVVSTNDSISFTREGERIVHFTQQNFSFIRLWDRVYQFISFSIHSSLFLDWSVWSYSQFIYHFYQTWMESAKFSIHFSILLDQESFIKFSNHLVFLSDLEVGQTQFISHFYQTWSLGHKLSSSQIILQWKGIRV